MIKNANAKVRIILNDIYCSDHLQVILNEKRFNLF